VQGRGVSTEVAGMIHRDDVLAELYFQMALQRIRNEDHDWIMGELIGLLEHPDTVG
jgi:hypothetical protein